MLTSIRLDDLSSEILLDLRDSASKALGSKASLSYVISDLLITFRSELDAKYNRMFRARTASTSDASSQ